MPDKARSRKPVLPPPKGLGHTKIAECTGCGVQGILIAEEYAKFICDLDPLDDIRELIALAQGRLTFRLVNRVTGVYGYARLIMDYNRDKELGRTQWLIVPQHICGTRVPTPPKEIYNASR